jgi:hypothetical protein
VNRSLILLVCAVVALAAGVLQPPALEARPNPAPLQQSARVAHLNPTLDTYVVQGEEVPLGVDQHIKAGASNKSEYLTLLRFDFPSWMVPGTQIISASLKLYCEQTESYDPGNRSFEIRLLTNDNWDNNTIYKNKPGQTGSPILWTMSECRDEWLTSSDVSDYVGKWFTGELDNNGFQLGLRDPQVGDTLISFKSKEGGGSPWPSGRQPELQIDVIVPPTPSPTASDTPTPTITPTASDTPTPSITPTPSNTPLYTDTPTPTETPTPTNTPEAPPGIYLPFTQRPHVDAPPTAEVTGTTEATPQATEEPMPEPTSPAPSVAGRLRQLLGRLGQLR